MKRLNYKHLIAVIACICLGIVPSFAGKTDYELKPGSFVGIDISNDFEVRVVEGAACRVKMSVESAYKDYVQASVKEGILSISVDEKKVPSEIKKQFKGNNKPTFSVTVVMPEKSLSSITLEDDTRLAAIENAVINTAALTMYLSGNSVVKDFTCETAALTLNLDKKAKASINTISENVKVTASGSASLDLEQESVEAELNLSSTCNVTLTGKTDSLMTVTSKGNAKSALNGETTHTVFTVSGTSNVNAINLACDDAEIKMSGLCTLMEAASKSIVITMANGSNLTFKNNPAITITSIKTSSVNPYNE